MGSEQRLQKLSFFKTDTHESVHPLNFNHKEEIVTMLDMLIANADGNIIILLPPGCQPTQSARKTLKKWHLLINHLGVGLHSTAEEKIFYNT